MAAVSVFASDPIQHNYFSRRNDHRLGTNSFTDYSTDMPFIRSNSPRATLPSLPSMPSVPYGKSSSTTLKPINGSLNMTAMNGPATPWDFDRTDVFPGLSLTSTGTSDDVPSESPSFTSFLTGTTGTGSSDVTEADTGVDGHDFNSSLAAPGTISYFGVSAVSPSAGSTQSLSSAWSTSTGAVELPMEVPTFRRVDSFVGKSEGFGLFASEIDAAPVAPAPLVPTLSEPGVAQLQYDFSVDSVSPAASRIGALGEYGLGYAPQSAFMTTPIYSAVAMQAARAAAVPVHIKHSIDDEPDADTSSVSEWSTPSSPPMSPSSVAPSSPSSPSALRSRRLANVLPRNSSSQSAALAAAAAIRPGPFTRGRAAAIAAPVAGSRELKPVPVARGPHAGLLGGGQMASVGIYTKDDRWRKIERLREKRRARVVVKSTSGQYACRKSFAERRPRVGGRFVKMDEETKRYLAATKPGAVAPNHLEAPAALKAYAAQTAASGNASIWHQQLAVAASSASQATAYTPLFSAGGHPPAIPSGMTTLSSVPHPTTGVAVPSQWYVPAVTTSV